MILSLCLLTQSINIYLLYSCGQNIPNSCMISQHTWFYFCYTKLAKGTVVCSPVYTVVDRSSNISFEKLHNYHTSTLISWKHAKFLFDICSLITYQTLIWLLLCCFCLVITHVTSLCLSAGKEKQQQGRIPMLLEVMLRRQPTNHRETMTDPPGCLTEHQSNWALLARHSSVLSSCLHSLIKQFYLYHKFITCIHIFNALCSFVLSW